MISEVSFLRMKLFDLFSQSSFLIKAIKRCFYNRKSHFSEEFATITEFFLMNFRSKKFSEPSIVDLRCLLMNKADKGLLFSINNE